MGQKPNHREIRQKGRRLERSIPATITFVDERRVTIEINRRQHTSLAANARRMNGNNGGLLVATDEKIAIDLRNFNPKKPAHERIGEILRSVFGPEIFPKNAHTVTIVPPLKEERAGRKKQHTVIVAPSVIYGIIRPIAQMVPDAVARVKGGSLIRIYNIESRLDEVDGLKEAYEDLKKAVGY